VIKRLLSKLSIDYGSILGIPNFGSPDADLLNEIISSQGESVYVKHVQGHQDRQQATLSHEAILNVEADQLATKSLGLRSSCSLTLSNQCASLMING
jgi:hypothetical protein